MFTCIYFIFVLSLFSSSVSLCLVSFTEIYIYIFKWIIKSLLKTSLTRTFFLSCLLFSPWWNTQHYQAAVIKRSEASPWHWSLKPEVGNEKPPNGRLCSKESSFRSFSFCNGKSPSWKKHVGFIVFLSCMFIGFDDVQIAIKSTKMQERNTIGPKLQIIWTISITSKWRFFQGKL